MGNLLLLFKRNHLFVLIVLSFSVFLSLAPCQAEALDIRAGIAQNPPLSFVDDQGQPAGLLVDLLNHIAGQAGWQVTYVHGSLADGVRRLSNHDIDLMVTIAYSKERAERFDYNQTTVVANWGVLYSSAVSEVPSYFDLKGRKVAVVGKDIHYRAFRGMLENFGIPVEYLELANFEQVFAALDSGKADVGVVNRFFALREEVNYSVNSTPLIFNPIEIHYATAKGENANLLQEIDRHLVMLKEDPSSAYYQALDRWLGLPGRGAIPQWLWPGLWGLGFLFTVSIFFVFLLRRQVAVRTRSLFREVDRREQAQQELLVAERNYRTLVEGAHAIILRWDCHGKIIYINDFGERLFGFDEGELIGRHLVGTIVPDVSTDGQDLAERIKDLCEKPEAYQTNENENMTKSGERIWSSWSNQPVVDQAGNVEGILSVGLDITERKKAELSRHKYELAKDTFVSSAAHELRTPLSVMIGYAEILADSCGTDNFLLEQRKDFLKTICDKGMGLSRIVDDLLDVGLIQKGRTVTLQRKKNSFAELTRNLLQQYQTLSTSHIFRLEIADAIFVEQFFDKERMAQVLENLLSNAVKYSSEGSEIVVMLDSADDELLVTVVDRGIGMTAEQVGKVFDDFYRVDSSDTAVSGLGLGMYIARQIVLEHGGKIWVESTPDVGTRACFTVPNSAAD